MENLNQVGRLDDAFISMAQRNYQNAKEKSVKQVKQKINGRLYVGKTTKCKKTQMHAKKTILMVTGAILIGGISYSTAVKNNTISDYNTAVYHQEQDIPFEKATDEYNYQNYKSETEPTGFEKLTQSKEILNEISEEKARLKATGDYGIFDANKLYDDAINNVAESHVDQMVNEAEEYSGGISHGK